MKEFIINFWYLHPVLFVILMIVCLAAIMPMLKDVSGCALFIVLGLAFTVLLVFFWWVALVIVAVIGIGWGCYILFEWVKIKIGKSRSK